MEDYCMIYDFSRCDKIFNARKNIFMYFRRKTREVLVLGTSLVQSALIHSFIYVDYRRLSIISSKVATIFYCKNINGYKECRHFNMIYIIQIYYMLEYDALLKYIYMYFKTTLYLQFLPNKTVLPIKYCCNQRYIFVINIEIAIR